MLRATFAGFSTAMSAIQANQKRLDITGQNLANMNTPGYTRQELRVSSLNYTHPVAHYANGTETVVGFGVHMDKVAQIRDPFLDAQYRDQIQKSGYTDGVQTALDRLSDIFDESEIEGIRKAFDNIQATLTNMQDQSKIDDPIFESELRARMQALTNMLNDADRQITQAERDEFSRLDGTGTNENGAVQEINDILKQISTLNRQIKDNQIFGQPSLELMDDRNLLLDELASYIPIEITYYKDAQHDGIGADGKEAIGEIYHLDSNGNPFAKKDWPDDLRVEMVYTDKDGKSQRLTLVEGTVGTGTDNIGGVAISNGSLDDPTKVALTFTAAAYEKDGTANGVAVKFDGDKTEGNLPYHSGSVQASLDMLWKDGKTAKRDDEQGYEYYRSQLDNLAYSFAAVMNEINKAGGGGNLLGMKAGATEPKVDAGNITIHSDWSSGASHIGKSGESSNDTVLNLIKAMTTSFNGANTQNKFYGADGKEIDLSHINLENNAFNDYTNHIATVLANNSYSNSQALKTNVTVLNGIQDSRDSISGVSLDEEAANMMVYMSAYNAASRLMTTLDEALNTLINNTGLVGR